MSNLNIKISIDDEIITDYRENFADQYEVAANCILQLENTPNNAEAIHAMFRALHTIKGNSNLCRLDILTKFSHAVEEITVAIRQNELTYTPQLGEVILLCLDKIKEVSEDLFNRRDVDTELLDEIENILLSVSQNPQKNIDQKASRIISLIANRAIIGDNLAVYGVEQLDSSQPAQNSDTEIKPPQDKINSLDYFQQLTLLLESKFPYWKGRSRRTMPLAIGLNQMMGNAEDPIQLKAAIYMHDISFAFLDEQMWQKQARFDANEMAQMRQHPVLSAKLLEIIPGWEDAVQIVLQHHERWDGTGYPNGVKGDQIRAGAQLLAVVDAFESMTHARPDRHYKRSTLRAMTEINNCSGAQFSPHVTSLFNAVVKDTLAQRKKTS
ncbi:MAG TPA: HD domain-containing phosphohydrolase [Gammaproteobacteria bacterium]